MVALGLCCCMGFLQVQGAGATLCRGAWTLLWLMGLVAPRHEGSFWTKDRTHVPYIDRQILNHWTTRESPQVLKCILMFYFIKTNIYYTEILDWRLKKACPVYSVEFTCTNWWFLPLQPSWAGCIIRCSPYFEVLIDFPPLLLVNSQNVALLHTNLN